MLSDLLGIIEENCKIEDKEKLIQNLNIYFEQRLINDIEENEDNITDFLTEKNIIINQKVENWEEAIRLAGKILVDNKITKVGYIDKMIENIKKFGSYVVVGENLAIPHSRSDETVLKTGMSLVVLKEPILFPENKKVQIILAFSSLDNKEHLNALAELTELITNYNLIENLLKAKNINQVLKCINFNKKV